MKKRDFTREIFQSPQTVFTAKEIALILAETNRDILKSKINYYVKKGILRAVRRGVYVKQNYNIFELATKIYTPSYISLETVLAKEGVIFQYYKTIFVVSYLSRKIEVDNHQIQLRKIKESILTNTTGLVQENNYFIATKERAFLDALYLYKDYYFDNLEILDKRKILKLAEIYKIKAFTKKLKRIFDKSYVRHPKT